MPVVMDALRTEPLLRRTDGYVHRNVAGEALLIPIRAQVADLKAAYLLNETAEFVYLKLDGKRGVVELVGLLAEAFAVPPERAREDILALLDLFREIGATEEAL